MSVKPTKVQFNGGELSPWLEGRVDIAKYDKTAKLCRNFIPLAEGSLKRRGGTRFVATTPVAKDLLFEIKTKPEDAFVYINGVERRLVNVVKGDVVEYEVSADGYETCSGKIIVNEDMEILVELVPNEDCVKLEIKTVPEDATVKIEGVERKIYISPKGKNVSYMAYKDGYEMMTGSIVMTKDHILTLTLSEVEEDGGSYGAWGTPVCFVACTAAYRLDLQLKAFCFKFTKGYLVILFNADKKVPDDLDKRLFFYETETGYDTVALKNNKYQLACLYADVDGNRYKDLDGKMIAAISAALEMPVVGWQLDEDLKYAGFYTRYDGTVLGNVVRIYYEGELVWKLKGEIING